MPGKPIFLELKLIEENRKAILELAKKLRIRIEQRLTPIPNLLGEHLEELELFEELH